MRGAAGGFPPHGSRFAEKGKPASEWAPAFVAGLLRPSAVATPGQAKHSLVSHRLDLTSPGFRA